MLLVRYVAQVIQESGPRQPGETGSFYDFLESCLRHKNDMVTVEAARAICNMKDVTTRELTPAVTVLQLMLSSSKPVIRSATQRHDADYTTHAALHAEHGHLPPLLAHLHISNVMLNLATTGQLCFCHVLCVPIIRPSSLEGIAGDITLKRGA